jgi:hypothetical protein
MSPAVRTKQAFRGKRLAACSNAFPQAERTSYLKYGGYAPV